LLGTWAVNTQKLLQARFPNDDNHILVPLLLYGDGVSVGWGSSRNFENATVSLGNFPADLTRSMLGKMNIGFTASVANKDLQYATLKQYLEIKLTNKTKADEAVKTIIYLI
jgi:hypothetical protein